MRHRATVLSDPQYAGKRMVCPKAWGIAREAVGPGYPLAQLRSGGIVPQHHRLEWALLGIQKHMRTGCTGYRDCQRRGVGPGLLAQAPQQPDGCLPDILRIQRPFPLQGRTHPLKMQELAVKIHQTALEPGRSQIQRQHDIHAPRRRAPRGILRAFVPPCHCCPPRAARKKPDFIPCGSPAQERCLPATPLN
jgi:hypothetical protein